MKVEYRCLQTTVSCHRENCIKSYLKKNLKSLAIPVNGTEEKTWFFPSTDGRDSKRHKYHAHTSFVTISSLCSGNTQYKCAIDGKRVFTSVGRVTGTENARARPCVRNDVKQNIPLLHTVGVTFIKTHAHTPCTSEELSKAYLFTTAMGNNILRLCTHEAQ